MSSAIDHDDDAPKLPIFFAMNAGNGPQSYVQNSSYQRGVLDSAKSIIEEEIAIKLDLERLVSTRPDALCIADLGCSTGHNSFPAIDFIIEAMKQKYESERLKVRIPEFRVIFNDIVTNDFNTLFASLPANRSYHAAGVAGDFHGRLMPESSLHFAYSSFALHWLTEVPKLVVTRDSPAWNEGRILYAGDRKEVCDAYSDQFRKDIDSFLESRAAEMVGGGLMALLFLGVPNPLNSETEFTFISWINDILGSCLMDMVKKGRLSKAKVDSFNIPIYAPTPEELKGVLERNQSFSIERIQIIDKHPGKYSLNDINARANILRAGLQGLLTHHFGSELVDELFHLYVQKLAVSPVFLNPDNDKSIMILAVLKRNIG